MSSDPSSTPLPPDNTPPTGKPATTTPSKKPRRLRKWMIGIGLLLVVLLLLVALAPTLIGTPPVRSFIVGRVNNSIPGNIALDDLSVGWTSGVRVSGLEIFDEQNALILEVPTFSTDLTLLKAIRGDLALGNTTADINATRVVIDENGVSNVERAFGLDRSETEAEKAKKKPKPDDPTELPDISGSIAINILGGTIEMPGTLQQPVHLQPGSIKAEIKNINDPINNSGDLGYRLGDAAPGKIRWNGNLDIADGNKLDLAKLSGTEDFTLENVNIAPITAFLPPEQKLKLEGIARAALQLKASGDDASLNGSIDLADLAVGGAPLNGDTYRTKALNIPIDITRTATGDKGSTIKIQNVGAQSDDFTLAINGSVSELALSNLSAMKPPGDTGDIKLDLKVPGLANLANQLPNTFKLAEGVTITEGLLTTSAHIALKPELASIAYDFAVSGNGTRDGQPVTLAPINLSLGGNLIPLGEERIPQVSEPKLTMRSNFATADGGGKSLEAINLELNFDLAAMQKELGQFVEFTDLELNGTGKLALATKGDVTQTAQPIATTLDLNLQQLTVRRTNIPGGNQDALANEDIRAQIAAAITLPEAGGFQADASTLSVTSASKLFSIEKSPDAKLTIVSPPGDEEMQANATVKIGADLKRLMDVGTVFSATQPAVPPASEPGQLKSAMLNAVLAIAPAEQNQMSIKLDGAINQLTVTTAENPIENETVKINVAAKTPEDFAKLFVDATVDSSFAKVVVSGADVLLAKPASGGGGGGATTAPSTFEMVQNAKVTATVPDLAKLYAVANAFAPSEPATAPAAEGAEQTPPPPPMQITGGNATLTMDVKRDGNATKATLADTQINDLAITRGEASYAFTQPVVINADLEVNALETLERLRVGELNVDLGGIATITLAEPLEVSGFEKEVPTARGTLNVNGQIEQLAKLLEAVQGTPDAYPYRGQLAMSQKLGTDNAGKLSLKGQTKATDFQTFTPGHDQPTFSEKELTLDNDLVVDPTAKTAFINALNLNMPNSQALQIAANGKLVDWEKQRQLDNIKLDLTYDLEKLWPIIMPLMGPESQEDLKELKIAGKTKRTFNISGSYPAVDASGNALAFNESIKSVVADGGLAVETFDYKGTKIDKLEIPLSLRNGRLDTVYADRKGAASVAPPAQCNGGLLNVSALLIDLTRPEGPRLSTGKNHELLKNVTINPLFADSILGKFINPAFVNPDKAQGLLSVTLVECNNVPLSDLIQQDIPANDGRADIRMSIIELAIGNEFLSKLVTTLKPNAFNNNALQGNIKDARIQIGNGMITENMAISIDEYALAFDGKVRLADQQLMPLNLKIPAALLDKVGENVLEYLPEGFNVPVTGTTTAPRLDLGSMLKQVAAGVAKAQLGNLLGGKDDEKSPPPKDNDGKPSTKPAEPQKPEDLAKDILEGLLKKK